MRSKLPLAIMGLLVMSGLVSSQERVPLPPPDPAPEGSPAVPAPPSGPPQPYIPPPGPMSPPPPPLPYSLNPPPPGMYAPLPYSAPSLVIRDPSCNPTLWLGVEGLIWWTKNQPLSVPVITTGPASQGDSAGNLGAPGTTSLNGPLNSGTQGGVRVFAGGWLDVDHTVGLDGSFFILGRQSASFSVLDRSGNGSFVINEPVVGAPFFTQVSAPGVETGGVFVTASSHFGGGDLNVLYNLHREKNWSIDLLGGYRYLELNETLTITANSTLFTTTTYTDNMGIVLVTAPPGSVVTMIDQFGTRNQFNGGQIGTRFQYLWGPWSLSGSAKLGIGDTHEVIQINGNTNVFPVNGTLVPLQGGNFATLQVGRYATDRFAVAPEAQINVGFQLTPHLRTQMGYSLLFLSSVARPGNQIDNSFDGGLHPGVPMISSSYWAQGLNLGLQVNF